jgi:hypothetical protein
MRGTDRTGTVTISVPFGLATTGRGPQSTRLLYETEGGFGKMIDAAAETLWGVAFEDVAQLGEDIDPETAAEALAEQLARDAAVHHEFEIDLPPNIKPYGIGAGVGDHSVWIGDRIQATSDLDGTVAPVRLTSLAGAVDDDNGEVAWIAGGELVV